MTPERLKEIERLVDPKWGQRLINDVVRELLAEIAHLTQSVKDLRWMTESLAADTDRSVERWRQANAECIALLKAKDAEIGHLKDEVAFWKKAVQGVDTPGHPSWNGHGEVTGQNCIFCGVDYHGTEKHHKPDCPWLLAKEEDD